MELKAFQQTVIKDLESFLQYIQEDKNYKSAFERYWTDRIGAYNSLEGTGMRPYRDNVGGAVHACIKVPTAGGKTFTACNILKSLFDASDLRKTRAVVWLVPWSNLLDQTYRSLSDPEHPYRQKLDTLFNGRVEIYKKEDLLQGAGFNPATVSEQLSIFVLSFASLRSRKKEDRKIYEENGQLAPFPPTWTDSGHILKDTDETALINVIRSFHPVLIVDESHNAESELSVEMLQNLNPCFILDLTATPKENSNIVSFVSAHELKKENMVKLPVIVYNHHDKSEVINSALHLQRKLEILAKEEQKKGEKYIRPIVLFQAQPRTRDDNVTFEKIKQRLLDLKIPEEQIRIKTAGRDELKGEKDLMSETCPVRYIITVNALKEGWDCPFAYILASLADKSSAVDVEQILGRVLRQPYIRKHPAPLLNVSYVLTASSKFYDTLQNIISGLQQAGFSKDDYRKKDLQESSEPEKPDPLVQMVFGDEKSSPESTDNADDAEDIDISKISFQADENPETEASENEIVADIEQTAIAQSQEFEEKISRERESEEAAVKEIPGVKVKQYRMKEIFAEKAAEIVLPRFFLKVPMTGLFESGDGWILLDRNNLLEGFPLRAQNTELDTESPDAELYKVDLEHIKENEYVPKFMKIESAEIKDRIFEYLISRPRESQIEEMTRQIMAHMGDMKAIADQELKIYIQRILEGMNAEQLRDCMNRPYTYKDRIKRKIRSLGDEYAQNEFFKHIDTGKITVRPDYRLPRSVIPGKPGADIMKSLYEREGFMNKFEEKVILDLSALENVVFWHKNLERGKGFALNGYKSNHYPDFILLTQKGNIILIESKGDDRDNSDSAAKNRLGKRWAELAGPNYKYFMVFDSNKIEDSRTLDEMREILREL